MNIEEYDDESMNDFEMDFQISYASGKPEPMKGKPFKTVPAWQRIERLKEEKMNKALFEDDLYRLD